MLEWVYLFFEYLFYVVILLLFVGRFFAKTTKRLKDCSGKHVLITGGSTGLGKSLAIKFAKLGANVTIIARDEKKLEETKKDVDAVKTNPSQKIVAISADVTKFTDIQQAIQRAVNENGVTDYVIANAGTSVPGYFLETSVENLEKEVNLNYLGTVYTIKSALPFMVDRNQGGHFVIVSSAAAFGNFIGYTNYGSTKRALSALAEGLRNELKLYGIAVSAFYPTGIDTEGFKNENKTKPEETTTLEGPSSVLSPDVVAQSLIDGMRSGKFSITNEFITELMRVGTNGTFSPRNNILMDVILGIIHLIVVNPLIFYWDWVVLHSKKRIVPK